MSNEKSKKLTWTEEEDNILREVLEKNCIRQKSNGTTVLSGSWGDVAQHLPGRSAKQCRERWCYNLSPTIRRDMWTLEEDATLIAWQSIIGNQWASIARKLQGRTENSVKIRFKSIKRARKRVWTKEDDEQLLNLHNTYGSRWDRIAELMPSRTRNSVKTRCLNLRKGISDPEPVEGAPEQILFHPDVLESKLAELSDCKDVAAPAFSPVSSCSNASEGVLGGSQLSSKKRVFALLDSTASDHGDETQSLSSDLFSRSPSEETGDFFPSSSTLKRRRTSNASALTQSSISQPSDLLPINLPKQELPSPVSVNAASYENLLSALARESSKQHHCPSITSECTNTSIQSLGLATAMESIIKTSMAQQALGVVANDPNGLLQLAANALALKIALSSSSSSSSHLTGSGGHSPTFTGSSATAASPSPLAVSNLQTLWNAGLGAAAARHQMAAPPVVPTDSSLLETMLKLSSQPRSRGSSLFSIHDQL